MMPSLHTRFKTVSAILFAGLLGYQSVGISQVQGPRPVRLSVAHEEALNAIEVPAGLGLNGPEQPCNDQDTHTATGLPQFLRQLSQQACSETDTTRFFQSMCREVQRGCLRNFGRTTCRRSYPRRHRRESTRRAVFEGAGALFYRLTHDDKMINRCCVNKGQRNRDCAERFQDTELTILRGLGHHDDDLAQYSAQIGRIEISEGNLMTSATEQFLEEIFIHELGHRCAHLNFESAAHYDQNAWGPADECHNPGLTTAHFENLIDPNTYHCVVNRILSSQAVCTRTQLDEVFADSIFFFRRTNIGIFADNCDPFDDDEHINQAIYFPCLIESTHLRARLCPRQNE